MDQQADVRTRPLRPDDLAAVVNVDKATIGRSRRAYIEARRDAALRHPDLHIQLAAEDASGLVGFVLARIVRGEFGRAEAAGVLEAIATSPELQGRGVGRALLGALEERLRKLGIHELTTEAEWTNHAMLRFLEHTGFKLAPRLVLERTVEPEAEL